MVVSAEQQWAHMTEAEKAPFYARWAAEAAKRKAQKELDTMATTTEITLPTYNGHTNYATWNVMLWIENEEWSYDNLQFFIVRNHDKTAFTHHLRNHLLRYIRETRDIDTGCYADIKGYANAHGKRVDYMIRRIDFEAISASLLDSYNAEQQAS